MSSRADGEKMLWPHTDFGIPSTIWSAAKEQARAAMIRRARSRDIISYSDLAREIGAYAFGPNDEASFHLLGETSSEEDAAGRGMLTAVVVHKTGDMQPGSGFFKLARHLGRDTARGGFLGNRDVEASRPLVGARVTLRRRSGPSLSRG